MNKVQIKITLEKVFTKSHHFLTQDSFSWASPLLVLAFFSPILWTIVPSLCLYFVRLVISLSTQASCVLDSKFYTGRYLAKNTHIYICCLSWKSLWKLLPAFTGSGYSSGWASRVKRLNTCLLELYWCMQRDVQLLCVLSFKATQLWCPLTLKARVF